MCYCETEAVQSARVSPPIPYKNIVFFHRNKLCNESPSPQLHGKRDAKDARAPLRGRARYNNNTIIPTHKV